METKLLEAFKMSMWWMMLKFIWTEKVTNKEVLVRANKARSILKTFWCRNHMAWAVLRHDNLLHITEGKMLGKGKATRGRKRIELLHDVMAGRDYGQLKI